MRFWILLTLLLPLVALGISPKSCAPAVAIKYDVFIDLDGVLIKRSSATTPMDRFVVAAGLGFEVFEGATSEIERLLRHPSVRVSFYSSSTPRRNREVLTQIHLPGEITLASAVEGRIFSGDCLAPATSALPIGLKKLDHPKILKILPDLNMSRAVLIDDHDYLPIGQRKNLILAGNGRSQRSLTGLKDAVDVFLAAVMAAEASKEVAFLEVLQSAISSALRL